MSINTVSPIIRKQLLKRNLLHSSTLKKYMSGDAYDYGLLKYANLDTPSNDYIKDSEDLVDKSNYYTPSQLVINRYSGKGYTHLVGINYSPNISSLYKSDSFYTLEEINKRVFTINRSRDPHPSYRMAMNAKGYTYLDLTGDIVSQDLAQLGDIIGGLTKGFDFSIFVIAPKEALSFFVIKDSVSPMVSVPLLIKSPYMIILLFVAPLESNVISIP